MKPGNHKYVAFLRGINVGGHHKVPMADLKTEMGKLNCESVITILNSGNIIFEHKEADISTLESRIKEQLEKAFGFPIPTLLRKAETITNLHAAEPFEDIAVTKDIRLYVSFLQEEKEEKLSLPYTNEDNSFQILEKADRVIISVLDLAGSKTPKAMGILEKIYGKDITTRNWKTIIRIIKKLEA
ncbi:MAG: DUF1697 domain-containing protein [Bacteroidota bacterium]